MLHQKIKRFKVMKQVVVNKEQQASAALAQVRNQLEQEKEKIEHLTQYQAEYRQYLNQQGSNGISMLQWHRTVHFINQLEQLMDQQQQVIKHWEQQEQQRIQTWKEWHLKRKNMEKFLEKLMSMHDKEMDTKEQKFIDDLIMQHLNRREC